MHLTDFSPLLVIYLLKGSRERKRGEKEREKERKRETDLLLWGVTETSTLMASAILDSVSPFSWLPPSVPIGLPTNPLFPHGPVSDCPPHQSLTPCTHPIYQAPVALTLLVTNPSRPPSHPLPLPPSSLFLLPLPPRPVLPLSPSCSVPPSLAAPSKLLEQRTS